MPAISDWNDAVIESIKALKALLSEHTKRIDALETRLATPPDPFGKFAESYIDSVDYRKDDYQPKRDVTVRRNARPAS